MKEKLQQLMKSEGLTSSRMAEILRIQPSGISHILAGRNKPGFDLLQKILRRFPRVNPDWLLLDSEQMYRTGNPKSSSSTNGTDAGNGRTDTGLFGAEPGTEIEHRRLGRSIDTNGRERQRAVEANRYGSSNPRRQ